jgi:uncharacterized membrane protein
MLWSPTVFLDAALSATHILTFGLGLTAVVLRGRALAGLLDAAGWKRLLAADSAWGAAAALWIATGLARVFLGPKDAVFYWQNGFFWIKMALFLAVFVLELAPMRTFIRARQAAARGAAPPAFDVARYRRVNALELALVIAIPFTAALMARGVWLF